MKKNKILLQHGNFFRSFEVAEETEKAVLFKTKNGPTWIPRKALRMDKQKIIYDGAYMYPYHVLKWFHSENPEILNIFN